MGLRFNQLAAIVAGGVAVDADVDLYEAAVIAAGSTLPSTHKAALVASMPALKSSGTWAKLKEFWFPLGADGDLTAACVKFKNGAVSASVTATAFIAGDYTVAGGFNPGASNASKKITTDFVPNTHGSLSAGNWGMSVFALSALTAGDLFGTTTGYAVIGQTTSGISVMSGAIVDLTSGRVTARLSSMQMVGTEGSAWIGGRKYQTNTVGTPSLPSVTMSVLSDDSANWGNARVGGYAIHDGLTSAELNALQTFFDDVSTAVGRTVFSETLIAMGDSWVDPTPIGPSDAAHAWPSLAAAAKGWPVSLKGVSGSGWTGGTGSDLDSTTGRNRLLSAILAQPSRHAVLCLGVNDANNSAAVVDVTASAEYAVDFLLDAGYPAEYLRIATPGYFTSLPIPARLPQIVAALEAVAASRGLTVIDLYNGRTLGDTATLLVDLLHRDDDGHALLALDFADETVGWA